jgi:GntR family transcriptional regulator
MFRVDPSSGVPIYRQLVEQVRRDVMLGRLQPGDQLPSLKEVVEALAINPNTVVKAYAELEHEGLAVRRQGTGTFLAPTLPAAALIAPPPIRRGLTRWVARAREAGMSSEQMQALLSAELDAGSADDDRSDDIGAGGVA